MTHEGCAAIGYRLATTSVVLCVRLREYVSDLTKHSAHVHVAPGRLHDAERDLLAAAVSCVIKSFSFSLSVYVFYG